MNMRLVIAFITELVHRYCFDNIYDNYETRRKKRKPLEYTLRERAIIAIYKTLCAIVPDFRQVLKRHVVRYDRYNVIE